MKEILIFRIQATYEQPRWVGTTRSGQEYWLVLRFSISETARFREQGCSGQGSSVGLIPAAPPRRCSARTAAEEAFS
jgi:hypothetical protein